MTAKAFEIKLQDHFKLYVLLKNKITFESELLNNEIHFYSNLNEQPIIDGGVRYFLLDPDRPKIDQIIMENDIIASTETIPISDYRDHKKSMKLYFYIAAIVVITMIFIGIMDKLL